MDPINLETLQWVGTEAPTHRKIGEQIHVSTSESRSLFPFSLCNRDGVLIL
jgi:hypothetical protein